MKNELISRKIAKLNTIYESISWTGSGLRSFGSKRSSPSKSESNGFQVCHLTSSGDCKNPTMEDQVWRPWSQAVGLAKRVFGRFTKRKTCEWLQSDRLLPGIEFNALRAGGNRDINTNGQGPFRLLLSFQVRFFSFQMLRQCKSGEIGSGQVSGVCFRICIVENE